MTKSRFPELDVLVTEDHDENFNDAPVVRIKESNELVGEWEWGLFEGEKREDARGAKARPEPFVNTNNSDFETWGEEDFFDLFSPSRKIATFNKESSSFTQRNNGPRGSGCCPKILKNTFCKLFFTLPLCFLQINRSTFVLCCINAQPSVAKDFSALRTSDTRENG